MTSSRRLHDCLATLVVTLLGTMAGCIHSPALLTRDKQTTIDRALVEYPAGFHVDAAAAWAERADRHHV